VPAYRLAEVDDHLLRDLGLHGTDLYALSHLHASRIKAACCRLGDVALRFISRCRPLPYC
jgi:hypothetical protein